MKHLSGVKLYGKQIRVTASKHQVVQLPKEGQPVSFAAAADDGDDHDDDGDDNDDDDDNDGDGDDDDNDGDDDNDDNNDDMMMMMMTKLGWKALMIYLNKNPYFFVTTEPTWDGVCAEMQIISNSFVVLKHLDWFTILKAIDAESLM